MHGRLACAVAARPVLLPSRTTTWRRGNSRLAGLSLQAAAGKVAAARPLLQPSADGSGIAELCTDCGLDFDAAQVPTISVIGPSRRGKSVLASLMAGGRANLFKQSHSSYKAMTSGTHVCEIQTETGTPLRIIDTEGLSHIGRSRKNEALVRQFLISTYLTSSWVVWLDTEVLSSGFFNTMWLVHDYVVDVLRIREASGDSLPGLVYIRTQETDVQKLEYNREFSDFGGFFSAVVEDHEDAHILTQMFAPGQIVGHSLPVWSMEDLENFDNEQFWLDGHKSPFKDAVASLCDRLAAAPRSEADCHGPPLLALNSLSKHLPKIARLEKFDPRDHEATKLGRLRAQLRGAYGSPLRSPLWLADLYNPEDKEVQEHALCIKAVARAKIHSICNDLRLDADIAEADPDVIAVLREFELAAKIFDAACAAFANEDFSEKTILLRAIRCWRLDADALADELWTALKEAEDKFLNATGLPRESLNKLRLHARLKWRIEDAIMQLRGRSVSDLHLRKADVKGHFEPTPVWKLGEWPGLAPGRGVASKVRRPEYSLWTDGPTWRLYEEKWLPQRDGAGFAIGELFDEGRLTEEEGMLPLPMATSQPLFSDKASL